MKLIAGIVSDLAVAFVVWMVALYASPGWLVFVAVLGLIAIVSIHSDTTRAITTKEEPDDHEV
jgi:hypothetical protein